MIEVVSISLGSRRDDADFTTRFLGKTMRVRRFGTDGSVAKAEALLKRWEPKADAIALGFTTTAARRARATTRRGARASSSA